MVKTFIHYFKPLGLMMLLGTGAGYVRAQAVRDSMRLLLNQGKEDTAKVQLYYAYGETFEQEIPDSATFYYNKARELSEKIGYKKGMGTYAGYQIVVLNNKGQFREALALALEALELFKKYGHKRELAVAYLNAGSEWEYLSDFTSAADYYLASKKIAQEINDERLLRKANNNLASVFIQLKEYEKGLSYAQESYEIARKQDDKYSQAYSLNNIGIASIHLRQFENALELFKEIGKIGREVNDNTIILDSWLGAADTYNRQNNFYMAKAYYDTVISFAITNHLQEYELYADMGMSEAMIQSHQYLKAMPYLKNGIMLAEIFGAKNEMHNLYKKTAEMYEGMGQWKEALEYRKKFEILNDSLVGEKSRTTIANLETKFEFEKKESRIRLQQATIKEKSTLNYILIGSTVLLFIILSLSYRNYRSYRKLQQQRILELETEKQLTATEAILKGEEKERSRLAKDLHDGLGGMLSGIKYSLNNMKENLIMTPDNVRAFEHSIYMLDSSINEMRRVAHNLMPEALLKFGLDEALNDFLKELNNNGVLKITYQSWDLEEAKIEQSLSVTIYRIIQELLNNIIKHAAAEQALVQVSATENQLVITVEDDGKGIDSDQLSSARGIGWKNIQSRIDYHKGAFNIQSEPGKGTSVFIEFPLL